jgi:carotenoid cleavage dioxygenase
VRWFDAAPTYVLHFANAFEDGDEVVLDGFFQAKPSASLDMNELGCRPWRWRFDLRTGRTREEPLGDLCCEFPTIDARDRGRPYRHMVTATGTPGMFTFDGLLRHDLDTGAVQRFRFPDGVVGSEAPVTGAHVVTFVSDVPRDRSECWIFDAAHLDAGPIARVALPERIASGTHACWSAAAS